MCNKQLKYGDKISSNVYFIKVLNNLGIKGKYIGFYYLVDILDLLINHGMATNNFSHNIYPIVSKKYDKTIATVERNIRVLIEKCWNNNLLKSICPTGEYNGLPTCCNFIKLLKKYIILQIS